MKKATLGLVLAMVLAVLPVSLFASTAGAADSTTVHIINAQLAGQKTIDVYANGILVVEQLAISAGIDVTLPDGTVYITACTSNSDGITGAGDCRDVTGQAPSSNVGDPQQAFQLDANSNYALAIEDGIVAGEGHQLFKADLSPTGLGEFRYTFNNAVPYPGPTPPAFDVCIDGNKVVRDVEFGEQAVADVFAGQDLPYAVFASTGDDTCASPNANVSFVAGTNFVQTATASQPSGSGGNQVLFVGEDTVPNDPDTVLFCNTILDGPASLSGFGPALKALIGNVDPTSEQTIKNTQPSFGAQQDFVATYTEVLDKGDASVPPSIADSWATTSAGIRKLLQTFKLASYDLTNLPTHAVEQLVLGANGIKLPGVPPDEDVVLATANLTAFITSTCLAGPTPGPTPGPGPAPAPTPVNVGPRFTG